MASQMIRSSKALLLLRKQMQSFSIRCNEYHGRAKIGKREVVGFGLNGEYSYIDTMDVPMPAIRFREESEEIKQLREKEKQDWNKLTIDEKKKLYRFSFCRTYAEMSAPSGEWKSITAGVLATISVALWLYVLLKKFVYDPLPESTSMEWRKKQRDWMVMWGANPIEGISSKWDYDKNRWKD